MVSTCIQVATGFGMGSRLGVGKGAVAFILSLALLFV